MKSSHCEDSYALLEKTFTDMTMLLEKWISKCVSLQGWEYNYNLPNRNLIPICIKEVCYTYDQLVPIIFDELDESWGLADVRIAVAMR